MNSLKTPGALTIVIALLFFLVSCKKDHDAASTNTVTKDQLVGKWNMFIQADAGKISALATIKGSGAMEIDQQPYDGITDLVLLWDVNDNKFTAHVDANGVKNYWKLDGSVDPKTLSIAGELVTNTNPPANAIFTLDKQ